MSEHTPAPAAADYSGPELCRLTAREAVRLLKCGDISLQDLLDAVFERIHTVEPSVNALPILCEDRARQDAANLPGRKAKHDREPGWLAGLPVTIKDLNAVSGVRTTYGTLGMADFVPNESDVLVERLEDRGGLVFAKSNTPEFGAGANTFNAVFGMTRNPWDTRRNAGGSSGGAAVSLATGEAWLSHGSDLAGSLRTPAAYCGVVGLRPTPGRVASGPSPAGFLTEGVSGPMARDIRDVALFLDAMSGFDPRVPISIDAPAQSYQDAVRAADEHVRIAFSEDQNGFAPVNGEIRTVLRSAMDAVSRAGGSVEEACPDLPDLYETYVTLRAVHYGAINARVAPDIRKHFKATLRQNVEAGECLTSDKIYDAMRARTALYHIMQIFLTGYDVLAIPVVGLEPGPVEEEYPAEVDGEPVSDYIDWLRFSFLATTTALPALSLPVGFTHSGMPVGLQLVGPPRGEAVLLRTARAVEAAVGFPTGPIDPVVRHG